MPRLEEHLQALRAQVRATQRALRITSQMLAEADRLLELDRIAKEAERNEQHSRDAVRVG